MREFLPVERVTLVRVVDYDLTVVGVDEGLPDGVCAVGGIGAGAAGYVGEVGP